MNNVDVTSVQHLIDVRNQLDRYTSPQRVDWHFAHINNRWTKRALVSAGFGYPSPQEAVGSWKPIFSVAEIGGRDSAAAAAADLEKKRAARTDLEAARAGSRSGGEGDQIKSHVLETSNGDARSSGDSIEYAKGLAQSKAYKRDGGSGRVAVVHGLNRPLFHIDLTSALQSAIANAERKGAEGFGEREGEGEPQVVAGEH